LSAVPDPDGARPSDVSSRVLAALARPTIGHLDPAFQGLMEEIKTALAEDERPGYACVPPFAPGTAGMEAALMNLLSGRHRPRGVNGQFGERMVDTAAAPRGGPARRPCWGTPVDPGRWPRR
jgi:alanine-glyoxylate transaminase/serine-glyoxylate transaminase/serine-pyruvate transaminase